MSEEKKDRIPRTMVGEVDVKKSQTTAHQTGTLPSTGEEAGPKEQPGKTSHNQVAVGLIVAVLVIGGVFVAGMPDQRTCREARMARLGAITDNIKRYGGRIISGRSIGPIHRELEKANEERRAERLKREEEEACSWF